jgi:RND family efflux transporter MFP subunit
MPTGPDPTEVTAARAVKAPPPAAEFTGVVTSRRSSVISSQVQAPLVKLNVHAGQLIKAGDVVAQLDETELKTRLDQARSNEQSAQMEAGSFGAQVSALRQKAEASAHLHKLRIEPAMAVSTALADLRQAAAQGAAAAAKAASARAAREQAEKDLAKAQIFSPLTGIVTNIKAREGEVPQVGTPLARVFDPSDLIIRFAVPREHRGELQLGQRVELAVDGNARPVWATVTNISGAQEPPINFTVVEADIDDTKLAPGELTVASVGRVRIADARGAKR